MRTVNQDNVCRMGLFGGNWMIKVVGHAVEADEAEIPEWRPVAKAKVK